jgi:hypothetical protein
LKIPLVDKGVNVNKVKIVWHPRETSRKTEKTNINLLYRKKLVYSTQRNIAYPCGINKKQGLSCTAEGSSNEIHERPIWQSMLDCN